MRISNLMASFIMVGFAAQAAAEEAAPMSSNESRGLSYSTGADSATLPQGVARVRLPYQAVKGNTTYDKDGNKSDSAATVTATAGAVVLEYGLSNDLSLQMKVDYRMNQKISITDKYRSDAVAGAVAANKAATYSSQLATLATATGVTITDKASLETALQTAIIGGCAPTLGSVAACSAAYAGGALKSDTLPTSLTSVFGAGSSSVSAKEYVSAAGAGTETKIISGITTAANTKIDAAEYEGNASLADTIVGVLYNPIKTAPFYAAVGAGLRIPTGNRNLAVGEQDATRSAYEFGVRVNLDYLPADWFMVSWQNQMELPLAGSKREVGGVSQENTRKGARNVGFLTFKPSLHVIHPSLEAVRTNFGLTYDYDNGEITKVNGVKSGGARTSQSWTAIGVGYSFLHSMKLPLQLDVDYEMPRSGTNVSIATTKTTATLKGYYRF